jgi:hypothetical protein
VALNEQKNRFEPMYSHRKLLMTGDRSGGVASKTCTLQETTGSGQKKSQNACAVSKLDTTGDCTW